MAWSGAYIAASAGAAALATATVGAAGSSGAGGGDASGSQRASASGSGSRTRWKRGAKRVATQQSNPADEPLPSIHSLDSAFQMAEYLELLVQRDPHDIERIVVLPAEIVDEAQRDGRDTRQEQALWIYEHLRRIPLDLVPLIAALLAPSSSLSSGADAPAQPTCSRASCPEMRAEGWQYICVAHNGREGEDCCAIDYILHTIDSMTASLVSAQSFPSRLSIKPGSEKLFPLLARRISRVFSHAFFHHRDVFEAAEAETALYARFVMLAERYRLVAPELLVIPREAVSGLARGNGKGAAGDAGAQGADGTARGAESGPSSGPDTNSNARADAGGGDANMAAAADADAPTSTSSDSDDSTTDEPTSAVPPTSRKAVRDESDPDAPGDGPQRSGGHREGGRGAGGRGRGRGRGRGGTARTLFPVEIQKEEDADDDEEEEVADPLVDEERARAHYESQKSTAGDDDDDDSDLDPYEKAQRAHERARAAMTREQLLAEFDQQYGAGPASEP